MFMKAIEKMYNLEKMNSLEVFARKRVINQMDLYGDELTPRY